MMTPREEPRRLLRMIVELRGLLEALPPASPYDEGERKGPAQQIEDAILGICNFVESKDRRPLLKKIAGFDPRPAECGRCQDSCRLSTVVSGRASCRRHACSAESWSSTSQVHVDPAT